MKYADKNTLVLAKKAGQKAQTASDEQLIEALRILSTEATRYTDAAWLAAAADRLQNYSYEEDARNE